MERVRLSFRSRILFVVLLVALLPLALVGLWLTGLAGRAGETLLLTRLDQARSDAVDAITTRWVTQRSLLVSLAQDPGVVALLENRSDGGGFSIEIPQMGGSLVALSILDSAGVVVWAAQPVATTPLDPTDPIREGEPSFAVRFVIWGRPSNEAIGSLEARLTAEAIFPAREIPPSTAGMLVALIDTETGNPLRPIAVDPNLLDAPEFRWAGDRWLLAGQALGEPPIRVVMAAPVTPFTAPFREAAARSALLILGVLSLGLLLAWGLALRLTGSLEELSDAAQAVAAGDLSRRVAVTESDEIGQVAEAFNAMTENLERTLDELAKRESLAAVGEFAASMAHEVRNPLTAIRIDLQRVHAGLPSDSPLRPTQERALAEVGRLNDSVQRTLISARAGGSRAAGRVDLRTPVAAAVNAAMPAFEERQARLEADLGADPANLEADADALEQLFLNILLNAAQALSVGGLATVSIDAGGGDEVQVAVEDGGVGIPEDLQDRIFEPLFTTTPEGTGLGLTIARRIAEAHGGTIGIESTPGKGTRVTVTLPAIQPEADGPSTRIL